MQRIPTALYTAAQVRELDRRVIEDHGVDAYVLMQRAGQAAFAVLREYWPDTKRIAVLAGRGNNGGDGYVIGKLAREAGLEVVLCRLGDHGKLSGAAKQAALVYRDSGGEVSRFEANGLPEAALYVDAMLGTGLGRPLEGAYREAVQALNQSGQPVFAVDVPTGLHADTGAVLGDCARAQCTATFIGLKLGLFTGEGPVYAGRVVFDDLQAPATVYRDLPVAARRITEEPIKAWLPRRERSAHKGRFGHVLVLGGDHGMAGAARLAGEAALRAGAGLVSVATRPEHVVALVAGRPELMVHGVETADALQPLLERATALALGPGLGRGEWSRELWSAVVASGKPLVVDADGLNVLAEASGQGESRLKPLLQATDWILTPHPGEAGRLLGTDSAAVQADRPRAARSLAERYRAVVVLKGAGTLIAEPEGRLWLCDKGNPGMASGGMGDVLTGLIAGMLAQKLDPLAAARAGVWLHAAAADRAAGTAGERGLIASDLFTELRVLLNPHA